MGFSSSHIETHVDHEGEEVPSLHSPHEELLELMSVVKDYEGTMVGYVLTGFKPDRQAMRKMAEVSLAADRPYAWPLLVPGLHGADIMDAKMAATDVARELGAELRVQAPSCPVGVFISFKNGLGFDMFPGAWKDVYRKDRAGRLAAFSDPELRIRLEEDAGNLPPGANGQYRAAFDNYEVQSVNSPQYKKYVGRRMGDIAKEEGRSAFQIILVTDAAQRHTGSELFHSNSLDRTLGHSRREESGRQSIGRNAVAPPASRQRPREVDHRTLARIVGNRLHLS